jgi:hypothetical protein
MLFVATFLVIVLRSLGLVTSITLCPLMTFVIKNLSFSVVVSFFVV